MLLLFLSLYIIDSLPPRIFFRVFFLLSADIFFFKINLFERYQQTTLGGKELTVDLSDPMHVGKI